MWRGIGAGGSEQALDLVDGIHVGLSPLAHRLPDKQPVEWWRGHRGIVALHTLRQRPAALPPFEAGLGRGGLLGILPDQDMHGELVGLRAGLQIPVKAQQALLFPFVATAQGLPMGQMLAHGWA